MSTFTSRLRLALWGLVVLAAVAAVLVFTMVPRGGTGGAAIGGGDYALIDDSGAPFDRTRLEGRPSLLFFGFTHCPDVCPTTMGEMAVWFENLGDEARDLGAFFVSVDPERDRPEIIHDYVSWLDGRVTGVTGTVAEVDKMVRAWRVFYEKVPVGDDDYTVNHTASVFLVNARGEFEGTIAYQEDSRVAVDKIRKLLGT